MREAAKKGRNQRHERKQQRSLLSDMLVGWRNAKRSFALYSLAVSPPWYARGIDAGAFRLWNTCKTVSPSSSEFGFAKAQARLQLEKANMCLRLHGGRRH